MYMFRVRKQLLETYINLSHLLMINVQCMGIAVTCRDIE